MRIAIIGSSGFLGRYLSRRWVENGNEILPITKIQMSSQANFLQALEGTDVVVNLAGAPILHKWTDEYKEILKESRIKTTQQIVRTMSNINNPPKLFISVSAVGIYLAGSVSDERNSHYGKDFLAKLAKSWEFEALKANDFNIRTVIFRLGVVLGKNGGALAQMLPAFKKGFGGVLGSGKQYISWVHIEDVFRAFDLATKNKNYSGIYNITAPNAVTNKEFTKALAKTLKVRTFFKIPSFILKFIYKEASGVLLYGQQAIPKKLVESGFKFKFHYIEDALEDVLS